MRLRWTKVVVAALLLGCGSGDDEGAATDATTPSPTSDGEATGNEGGDDADDDATGDDTIGSDDGDPAMRPTWHEDVAPFVAVHCRSCHVEGGIAPFAMPDYASVVPYAGAMMLAAEDGSMPPWHAVETEECTPVHPFVNDARLSAEQIQMLRDWVELGAPEGDPADAAPVPEPLSLDLADPSVAVTMGGSITVAPQGSALDFFHCLSFDPGNDQDVFVDGMQIIPGNDKIVHHVLIFFDEGAQSAGWPDGILENCGGGAGVAAGKLVGGWAPGTLPIETPANVGVRLPAGARIIFNMHYHADTTGPQTDTDTAVALRWKTTAPEYVSEFNLIGAPGGGDIKNPPFMIPAGASGHEEVVELVVPPLGGAEVRVWSVINHMHKVGIDMKTSVLRGGTEHCMVQTPKWDFDWQRLYQYDVPIGETFQVQEGDVVRVRCTYDNTLNNAAVVAALQELGFDEPQDVFLGEATLDEMCLAGVGVAIKL